MRNEFSARRWWLAGLCCAVYAAMWIGWVQGWVWLATLDSWCLDRFHEAGVAHPWWVPLWNGICTVFGPLALRIAVGALIVWLLFRRMVRTAMFLLLTVELSGVLTEVAKRLANRPRPATHMVQEYGTSFPSGHALGVMVGVLALLAVFLPLLADRWRIVATILGASIIAVVGIGRVALNVHNPSDVLAGWLLGYAYFVLCLPVLVGGSRDVVNAVRAGP